MPFTTQFAGDLLDGILNAADVGTLLTDHGSGPIDLHISLHTADPGAGGNQTTNEATYGDYAREALPRGGSPLFWDIDGNVASPTENIAFTEASSGTETITHVGIGIALTSTGYLMLRGELSPSIEVTAGVTPRILAGSTITFLTT